LKLSLVAIAYTADDHDTQVAPIRQLYQALEYECDGAITSASMKGAFKNVPKNGGGVVIMVIRELHRYFEYINADGSGAITWIEFLALFIEVEGTKKNLPVKSFKKGANGNSPSDENARAPTIRISTDVCKRAFDLLSDGSDKITSITIGEVFTPVKVDRVLNYETRTKLVKLWAGGFCHYLERDKLIRQVEPHGSLSFAEFMRMLREAGEPFPGPDDWTLPDSPRLQTFLLLSQSTSSILPPSGGRVERI